MPKSKTCFQYLKEVNLKKQLQVLREKKLLKSNHFTLQKIKLVCDKNFNCQFSERCSCEEVLLHERDPNLNDTAEKNNLELPNLSKSSLDFVNPFIENFDIILADVNNFVWGPQNEIIYYKGGF